MMGMADKTINDTMSSLSPLSPPEGVVGVISGYMEMFGSSDIMCELYSDQVEVGHRSDLSSHK